MHGFNQITQSPFEGSDIEEFARYAFPYQYVDTLMAPMESLARHPEEFFLGCDVSPCAFEMYWRLRGMEDTFIDMAESPDIFATQIQKCCEFAVRLSEEAFERFPLDWLWTGDDVASQTGLLFSPELWRGVIKPELKRIFDVAKKRNIPVAYHCCGALIPSSRT
ncbi:MAG TPA: uroporphyrinogen decarboxylase family protein [Spirochaetia bacterium]|nr:uroporphyrinogen decarboxylase family protein [Spirochaetia bacterium]